MADTSTDKTTAPDPYAETLNGIAASQADGTVTFSRPGIEQQEFKVKGGKFVGLTDEGRVWLLTHVAGVTPETE